MLSFFVSRGHYLLGQKWNFAWNSQYKDTKDTTFTVLLFEQQLCVLKEIFDQAKLHFEKIRLFLYKSPPKSLLFFIYFLFLVLNLIYRLEMENNRVFSIYEKYLTADNYTDAEDESDIELSFGDGLLEDVVIKSKSRRSSVSPLNTTSQTKTQTSFEEKIPAPQVDQGRLMNIAADLLQSSDTYATIPSDIRTKLSQIGDENVLNFIVDLLEDFKKKQDHEPKEFALKRLEKSRNELATIKRLLGEEESRFAQELSIIKETNFKEKFNMDATMKEKTNLKEILNDIQKNTTLLKKETITVAICKQVGLKSMPLP